MYIDCHVHLDSYSDSELADVMDRGRAAGVGFVISAGTTLNSTRRSIEISGKHPDFFSGIGIHPMNIEEPFSEETFDTLRAMAVENEKVIVVSEVGLDFMENTPDRAMQYHAFREQIRLARNLSLPVVFHSRESHPEVLRVLREERAYEVGGVMHYFQADEATARAAIDLGFYISVARPLLRLPDLQETITRIPLENIVLETDAAPQPFKAKRENWTEPRHLHDIARKLASLKGLEIEQVQNAVSNNILSVLENKRSVIQRYVPDVRQFVSAKPG